MQFNFDHPFGRLTFFDSWVPGTRIENASAWVTYHLDDNRLRKALLSGTGASIQEREIIDVHGPGSQWVLNCPTNPNGIQLNYHINSYKEHSFVILRISISNLSRIPIYLDELCLCQADPSSGGRVCLPPSADGYHFFKVGWHGWGYTGWHQASSRNTQTWPDRLTRLSYSNPVTSQTAKRGEFSSEGWAIIKGNSSAVIAGFASTMDHFGQVYANLQPAQEAISLICQADGIRLDPEERHDSDWGFLQIMNLPNPSPEAEFVEAVKKQMHARVPASPPPAMWTHWYQFFHDIDEQRFIRNLDQLVEKRMDVPCQLVELDDGYQSAWGDWTSANPKFPGGLDWLAKEIQGRGFQAGLWLAPFTVQITSQVARSHPDWLVKDRKGSPARSGFLYNMFIYALDLTHPEVQAHLRQLAHTIVQDWGYAMLKIDFLNSAALPGRRFNPKLTRAEALRQGLDAIRQGVGEQTFLLGCGCPFGPAIGVVDAMRIGPDTAPSWKPYLNWLPWAGPLIKSNPSMPALRNAMRNTLFLSSLNRQWWWNDPDCLLVRDTGTQLTAAEVQSSLSLVGLSGGMLVSSDDLGNVSDERLKWLSLLLPNLGLKGVVQAPFDNGMPSVYQVKVEQGRSTWHLVALFNWSDEPAERRLSMNQLGYAKGNALHVFDFWDQKYQRVTEPQIVFENVPAHGCKLLRLCWVENVPQLVGDTLHISQGVEISFMRIVDGILEVETFDLGRKGVGELWFALENAPHEVTCNGKTIIAEEVGQGIYKLHLDFIGKAVIRIVV